MGYAGRMLAKHDPWLNFGLWAVLVGLLNFSVICGIKQEQTIWVIAVSAIVVSLVCSVIILLSFFVGARQQSYRNRYKAELELSKKEEWFLHAGAFIISFLTVIAVLFAICILIWWIASLFI